MKRLLMSAIVTLILIAIGTGYAADQTAEEILKAIVKVRAVIHDDAVTAQSLGIEREGNGVLIDSAGHILTIGYLILESKIIEVTGPDGRVMNATLIGYDYETGFGILRVKTALDIAPIKLGSSSKLKTDESHGRVFLIRIHPGGPAHKANLQVGDLILKVNNQSVEGQADFFRKAWALGTAGVKVPISILRGTKIKDITLQSADRYQFIKRGHEVDGKRETL